MGIGADLLNALGINPDKCKDATIKVERDYLEVNVTHIVTKHGSFDTIKKQYRIVEDDGSEIKQNKNK